MRTDIVQNPKRLPRYHDNLLIVRLRTGPTAFAATSAVAEGRSFNAPGLMTLRAMEEAGQIRQITPLARATTDEASAFSFAASRAFSALNVAQRLPAAEDITAGVSFIELAPGADLRGLQKSLRSDPQVEYVSRVPVRYLPLVGSTATATPPDPSTLWNLQRIQWQAARSRPGFREATEIRVAVLDSGIDRDHPDLQGRVADYVWDHPDVQLPPSERDIVGHGTHVAGTIGATINNSLGIDGVCACELHAWKIFYDNWFGYAGTNSSNQDIFLPIVHPVIYRRALVSCLQPGMDIINLSIGGPEPPDPTEKDLFAKLLARGTVVVVAMGNERQQGSPISYPAAIDGVIAVGATDSNDKVADFSNGGQHIALSAPGVDIWSTVPTYSANDTIYGLKDGRGRLVQLVLVPDRAVDYASWQGTSMAAPHVTAAVALLLANNGTMTPKDVRDKLMSTSDKVAGMSGQNFHVDYGAGRLNLQRLLS